MKQNKEKITQRNPYNGEIEWTDWAKEQCETDPTYVAKLAKQLIYEYERRDETHSPDVTRTEPSEPL